MSHSLLLIPMEGDLELFNSDLPINVEATLLERSEGVAIHLDMYIDDESNGSLHFLIKPNDERNYRAERGVTFMTGMHIELTGNVAMLNAQPALVDALVRELSADGRGGR